MAAARGLKILYLIPRLARAGTEKHLLGLAQGLWGQGFDVTICCLFEIGQGEQERDDSCPKIICLNRKNIYDLRIISDLYKIFKKGNYDIAHSYLFGFHYLASLPAKMAGVPLVISSRRELAKWKKSHHHFLENLGNLFTDRVIACSAAARNFALKSECLTAGKIVTIYNGVNLQKFQPQQKNQKVLDELGLRENDKIIGMVANFSPTKDHRTMIKAVGEVKRTYPQVKCILVGDGPLRKNLENYTEDLGLKNNIIFLGQRKDIAEILSVMNILVLTSLIEGLPNVILEAMACGLPVVATDVGGVPEVVQDGKNGILVKPQNPLAIAGGIIKLLRDEDLCKTIGACGRKIIEEKFSRERMVRDYEKFYLTGGL